MNTIPSCPTDTVHGSRPQIRSASTLSLRLAFCLTILLSASFNVLSFGQGSAEDYQRMDRIGRLGNNLVDRVNLRTHWLTDQSALWYEVDVAPRRSEYYWVDLVAGQKTLLFSSDQIAERCNELAPDETRSNQDEFRNLPLLFGDSLDEIYIAVQNNRYVFQRDTGTLAVAAADQFPKAPLEKVVELKTSGASDQRINLSIRNRLETSIEMIWVDPQGAARSYGMVEAGRTNNLSTYQSHVWLLRSHDGNNLALVEARFDGQEVALESAEAIEIQVPRSLRRQAAFYQQGNPRSDASGRRRPAGRDRTAEANAREEISGPVQIARPQRRSPDGQWEAQVQDHQIVLSHREREQPTIISTSADDSDFFNGQFYWSPDSKFLIAMQEQPPQKHEVYLIESAPRDQLQPQLHQFDYLKPGDQIRQLKPRLFDVEQGVQVAVDETLFDNPWSVHDFRWATDSSEFSFRYNQRGHQVMRVVGILTDGTTRAIIDEVSDTFIDYTGKFFVEHLDQTGEIVWASQRDGWNHLYLYDRESGQVKNQITQGSWVVREVQRVDSENRRIWFSAGGIHSDQDPYHVHFCHIDFEGKDLVVMTAGDGDHQIRYSPDQKYLLDTYSRVDMPAVTEIREVATGRLICDLERGDWTRLLSAGWQPPQRFSAKGRDGQTDIFGVIYRPSNFDPARKYPVIEYIYAGPQGAFVPKSFGPSRWEKSLTELGFIVVQIDGMGTNHRSKAFHDVCWKNLGDAGFPDRILWMQAAAEMEPALDLSRVGIFGGSAGGQNAARAVLAFGDHYHVAVADCGCHDNRMDKIWWNEQWMGWPIDDHYAEQSNVTQAANLKGKLFLIVGELDRNVDPASTMQVVDALIRANKDFDLLVVPGGGHGIGSAAYGRRRTADFFVRHLWQTEPRAQ